MTALPYLMYQIIATDSQFYEARQYIKDKHRYIIHCYSGNISISMFFGLKLCCMKGCYQCCVTERDEYSNIFEYLFANMWYLNTNTDFQGYEYICIFGFRLENIRILKLLNMIKYSTEFWQWITRNLIYTSYMWL